MIREGLRENGCDVVDRSRLGVDDCMVSGRGFLLHFFMIDLGLSKHSENVATESSVMVETSDISILFD